MAQERILSAQSFDALGSAEKNAVVNLFGRHKVGDAINLSATVTHRQGFLATSLAHHADILDETDPSTFAFLTKKQRIETAKAFYLAFYYFSAQYQLAKIQERKQELEALSAKIKKSAELIDRLMNPGSVSVGYENHARYLGVAFVAPLAEAAIMEALDAEHLGAGKTSMVKEYIGAVNGQRLASVWGNSLVGSIFDMLPSEFGKPAAVQPYTGPLSFILYLTRGAIELRLLLKHTFKWAGMSPEEKMLDLSTAERFKTQWPQRKFIILNDFMWGFVNLASYVCQTILNLDNLGQINGTQINTGFALNSLTIGLLIIDMILVMVRFNQTSTRHNQEMKKYKDDMLALGIDDTHTEHSLVKAKKECEANWQQQKYRILNQVVHALGLIVGFTIMTCLTGGLLPLIGAAVCFTINTAFAIIDGSLEIKKLKASSKEAKAACELLLIEFNKPENNEDTKKLLYLQMRKLVAKSTHQEHLVSFQQKKLIVSVFLVAVVPALVFCSFMFFPLGIGVAAVAAGLAIALAVNLMLKKCEPKADALLEPKQTEYDEFVREAEGKTILTEVLLNKLKGTPEVGRQRDPGFFTRVGEPQAPLTNDDLGMAAPGL